MLKLCSKCEKPGEFYKDAHCPDGLSRWCKSCCKNRAKNWRKNNPEKKRESNAQWVKENAEKAQKSAREWGRRNKQTVLKNSRAWKKANPEKNRESYKKWYRNNYEKVLSNNRKYRSALAGVEDTLTENEWISILEYFNYSCAYCLRHDKKLTMDHVLAVSRGGGTTQDNIVPACLPCNSSKKDRGVLMMISPKSHAKTVEPLRTPSRLAVVFHGHRPSEQPLILA